MGRPPVSWAPPPKRCRPSRALPARHLPLSRPPFTAWNASRSGPLPQPPSWQCGLYPAAHMRSRPPPRSRSPSIFISYHPRDRMQVQLPSAPPLARVALARAAAPCASLGVSTCSPTDPTLCCRCNDNRPSRPIEVDSSAPRRIGRAACVLRRLARLQPIAYAAWKPSSCSCPPGLPDDSR